MYIMTSDGLNIVNSDFVERFCVVRKPDAALIIASYTSGEARPPVTIGRYADVKEARSVLSDMYYDMSNNKATYDMPESSLDAKSGKIHDARTKRKGGS